MNADRSGGRSVSARAVCLAPPLAICQTRLEEFNVTDRVVQSDARFSESVRNIRK